MSDLKALLLGPLDVAKWLSDMMTGEFYDILDVMTTWPLPDGSLSTKYRIIRYPLYLCTIIAKLISSGTVRGPRKRPKMGGMGKSWFDSLSYAELYEEHDWHLIFDVLWPHNQ